MAVVRLRLGLLVVALLACAPAGAQPLTATERLELSPADRGRLDALERQQAREDAQHRAEMKALREKLLRQPPLPPERNPLLGRWRVESDPRVRNPDSFSQLLGMVANIEATMCATMFGDGITEFRTRSWASIDSFGDDSLGPVEYRAAGDTVWVFPQKGVEMMGFKVVNANRIMLVIGDGCPLNRVGTAAQAAASAGAAKPAPPGARTGAAGSASNQVAAASPSLAPKAEFDRSACQKTVIDKLGSIRVDDVRPILQARYRETLTGTVPGSLNLRLDARGSPCDDPRINATLHDFDANGTLREVIYVWARPPGPSPAPLFAERANLVTRFHGAPSTQSPTRLQATSAMARVILQDLPERSLLLESYAAPK